MLNFLKAIGFYPRNCRVVGCEKESFAKKLCRSHYRQWVSVTHPSSRDQKSDSPQNIFHKS